MSLEHYIQNIKDLSAYLGLYPPIELEATFRTTLVLQNPAMVLHIDYDFEEECIVLKTPVSNTLPESAFGIQEIMNKLVGDLLQQKKLNTKLVADLDDNTLHLVQTIPLSPTKTSLITEALPEFSKEAALWQKKLITCVGKQSGYFEREIVSFGGI